ncbi:MAG: glycosyltransferase [Bacteroidales bacterium]|jgi:sugar transferase (PEP-CTERM/EpsH1 system associated)
MKIVVLLPRVPYPTIKGDKLRSYNFIRELSKNHEIHLFAIDEEKTKAEHIDHLRQFCASIYVAPISKFTIFINVLKAFFKGLPFQVGFYYSKPVHKKFNNYLNEVKPDRIFCQLIRVAEYVKDINDIKKTIDIQDTMSVNVLRNSTSSNWLKKHILKLESKRLVKYENKIFDYFENKIIISKPDRSLYPHANKDDIIIIPNGVNNNYFKPLNIEKEIDVVFTGNMGYLPNIDGSLFLIQDILPILKSKKPNIKIMIAGANPPIKLKNLASDNVIITGWVQDIRNCYAKSKVFIAPMRIGTGLQNKLLEAMAMKLPCITTPTANNSLGATYNESILIGKTKEELAKNILTLLDNKEKADEIANNGYKFVINNYNWETNGKKLEEIITS